MEIARTINQTLLTTLCGLLSLAVIASPPPLTSDGPDDHGVLSRDRLEQVRPSSALEAHDAAVSSIVSSAPFAKVTKNLAPAGRGERISPNSTTDVWALGNYAYTGTFNSPCGGEPGGGIFIWDVSNKNKVSQAGFIGSPVGSRSNDVRAATLNSGDILVHSNESCNGGPGGFEIYNVDDPTNPAHLASVQTDDVNLFLKSAFGFVDFGVHNLWLFSQGGKDYVAATVESEFGNFQIFDITDPANPVLVGFWGAEQLHRPDIDDWVNLDDFGIILDVDDYLFSGFGASQNRFLHDVTISADGNRAYLANWDAGLVLLDISDPTNPALVSVAIDPANGSLDGEVNSHSVWPSEDGTIVVAQDGTATPGDPTIPATAISTTAGDDFEANQTGNTGTTDGTTVEVISGPLAGNSYDAIELTTAAGSPTFADTGPLTGELVWLGRACTLTEGDSLLNSVDIDPGDIAVVRRGACEFDEKSQAAAGAGASAVIIANNQDSSPWSGMRIWSYADPANPVLASIFDTECSASIAPGGNCDARGTYSSHNVIVETSGNKVSAYVAWYSDGVVAIDVTDPFNPVETARFHRAGAEFEAENGGIQDIWGIYKVENSPWIYASDRNGGLYVLKEYGSGSAKKGKN
jgi:hypothetical protein